MVIFCYALLMYICYSGEWNG